MSPCTKHLRVTMEIPEIIESYSASLVREFLYRKGLRRTLCSMDSEYPRNALSISNTSVLVRRLKIEKIMKKNKSSRKPFSSILEVIVKNIKIRRQFFNEDISRHHKHNPPTILALSHLKNIHREMNERGENIDFLTLIKLYCGCGSRDCLPSDQPHNMQEGNALSYRGKQNSIKRDENGEATIEFDEKFHYRQRTPLTYSEKEASFLTEKENILKSSLLGETLPVCLSNCSAEKNIELDNQKEQNDISGEGESLVNPSASSISSSTRVLNSSRSHSPGSVVTMKTEKNVAIVKSPIITLTHVSLDDSPTVELTDQKDSVSPQVSNKSLDITPEYSDEEVLCDYDTRQTPVARKTECNENPSIINRLEMKKHNDDCCIPQLENHWKSQMVKILLAKNKSVSEQWLGQGFVFNDYPVSYGLIQNKDGCCGVLTSVNAYIIKELLFKEVRSDVEFLRPTASQLEPALVDAMSEILWQAGENKAILAILRKPSQEVKTIEDVIEKMEQVEFTTISDLQKSVRENLSSFREPGSHGCILFLISVILSRGIEKVLEDMNGVPSLITSNGFSTLEMVNLLLSGMAVSNVFDNHIKLQHATIKGIPKRSCIGYLSIKEHFKFCKVGSYLKTPRYPIWLVHSENLFTILFSCQKQLLSDWKVERKFNMTYYDPFKNNGKEIRLSIDTTKADDTNQTQENCKALVENCLRTKWKDANITWK